MYVKMIFATYLEMRKFSLDVEWTATLTEPTSSSDNRQGFRLGIPCEPGGRDGVRSGQTFELLADIRHLLVYPLLF
jgi:hypothetical protein